MNGEFQLIKQGPKENPRFGLIQQLKPHRQPQLHGMLGQESVTKPVKSRNLEGIGVSAQEPFNPFTQLLGRLARESERQQVRRRPVGVTFQEVSDPMRNDPSFTGPGSCQDQNWHTLGLDGLLLVGIQPIKKSATSPLRRTLRSRWRKGTQNGRDWSLGPRDQNRS